MSYRLCLLSDIPVVRLESGYATLALWARDLEAQVEAVDHLVLLCPVRQPAPGTTENPVALDPRIQIVDIEPL